jgi:uroporphyrinogen-III synthase
MGITAPIYLLSPSAYEGVNHLSIISFLPIEQSVDFSSYEYIVFTSKNAVNALDQSNPLWKTIPVITIGKATAKQVQKLGGKVEDIAKEAYGEDVAKLINSKYARKKLLYVRPKKVVTDLMEFVDYPSFITPFIAYETGCQTYKADQAPAKNAVIIFTSPSTYYCFKNNFSIDPTYKAVAIGKKTYEAIEGFTYKSVADAPNIESCIDKAKSISEN